MSPPRNDTACSAWWQTPLRLLNRFEPRSLLTGWGYFACAWSGRFGPAVAPPELEVLVPGDIDARGLAARLVSVDPACRWRVRAACDAEAALGTAPLIAACGGLRLEDGRPRLVFAHPLAQAQLEAGLLEPNRDAAAARPAAERLIALFPGLQAPFLGYQGRAVHDSLAEIDEEVRQGESGGRVATITLAEHDLPWIGAIRSWHAAARSRSHTVPMPPRGPLGEADPWSAPDAAFRDWLLAQTLLAGARATDRFLAQALAAQHHEQKPTHQGWQTWLHAVVAALQLETDSLTEHRRALRVAVLLHDVGKKHNVWTPGAHPLIGAKRWGALRPAWLTDAETRLVAFLIRTHDLLGRMDRAIMDAGFRGGVSPAAARSELVLSGLPLVLALRLNSAVYTADITSVPTLRWLRPLTPLLEGLVLAGGCGELVQT